jgi:MYXO-CTERM domain-containing protein
MRAPLLSLAVVLSSTVAVAASHPPGVQYPLKPAALQPSSLAQPLPSTRRYVLVWKDQLIPDAYSAALVDWVTTHYVGTQKLFQRQIDAYRQKNPNFLHLTYHLAYGLNGADQTAPVGNITGPNKYGQEDTDTFTPWVQAHAATREPMYQHSSTTISAATRVGYPDPFWLMDVASADWRAYLEDTLLAWMAFPTAKSTGAFLDVAFYPWYAYTPSNWWTVPAGGATRADLRTWWNPRAQAYYEALRTAFAPQAGRPRYLVVPNVDAMVDATDEYQFLDGTDGAFTENWQAITASPGDWNLSVRRIAQYVTSKAKLWMVDVTKDVPPADRQLLLGTFLLLRNGTSYIMFGGGDLSWYPEYEIDVGGYTAEPPADIETLRVAGAGGAQGGLYARPHVAGVVLVNSSAAAQTYTVASPMKQAEWSGGGAVDANGNEAAETLTYTKDVPAGQLSVPARSVVILRAPGGAPPPGVEPGDTVGGEGPGGNVPGGNDAGQSGSDGGATGPGADAQAQGDNGAGPSDNGGGCSCRSSQAPPAPWALLAALALYGVRRRRR